MIDPRIKLIAIVGPTASGKTDLSLSIATKYNGEILCADSRTVYRGMDIGTAKPTMIEQGLVPHHLLDIADPGETVTAAAFKRLAEAAIADIAGRGKLPVIVGGSGMYVDALLYDYNFAEESDPVLRSELQKLSHEQRVERLRHELPAIASNLDLANPRRVLRALETGVAPKTRPAHQRANALTLGLRLNNDRMQERITERIEAMVAAGFIDEVRRLGSRYGWDNEAMSGIGYRAFAGVIRGDSTVQEATAAFIRGDRQLVKRQLTWFRRNHDIHWLGDPAAADALVAGFLTAGTPA